MGHIKRNGTSLHHRRSLLRSLRSRGVCLLWHHRLRRADTHGPPHENGPRRSVHQHVYIYQGQVSCQGPCKGQGCSKEGPCEEGSCEEPLCQEGCCKGAPAPVMEGAKMFIWSK